jgi:very-short-patch-repair endonuclease
MVNKLNPPLPTRSRSFARELRREETDAERRLWFHLRGSHLSGAKFRRQHPVPPYVVDFYCAACKLGVELDGSQHSDAGDAQRTRFLKRKGIRLLRFWDNDVLSNTVGVLEVIHAALQSRTLTPTPLPMGEGLKQKLSNARDKEADS